MKKYILLVFCISFLNINLSWSAGKNTLSNEATVNIPHLQAYPGDVVDVPVTVTGFENIGMFQLFIEFNHEVLEAVDLVNVHPNLGSIVKNLGQEGIIIMNWFSVPNGAYIPHGDKLFDMRFNYCSDSLNCILNESTSPINFIEADCLAAEPNFTMINLNFEHGSLSANEPLVALNMNITGDGLVNVNGEPYTDNMLVPEGTTVTLDAVAETGWHFTGWSADLSGANNPVELIMDSNKEINVVFEQLPVLTYTLKFFLEGLYDNHTGEMRKAKWLNPDTGELEDKFDGTVSDLITVELHEPDNYGVPAYVYHDIELHQNGTANFIVDDSISGEFYITIRHKNHLETVSASPVDPTIINTYNFTTAAGKAFGDNMLELQPGIWGFFAGDILQNGTIALTDLIQVNASARANEVGYINTDINGDGEVSLPDIIIVSARARAGIEKQIPGQ